MTIPACDPSVTAQLEDEILDLIFDPEQTFQFSETSPSPDQTHRPIYASEDVKGKNEEAIRLAETGQLEQALALLEEALALPGSSIDAATLNNRFEEASKDIDAAIEATRTQPDPCTARQAYAQRGMMKKLGQYRSMNSKEAEASKSSSYMQDLEVAAQLGHPTARLVVKQENPYAALCNDMLKQVLSQYRQP